MDNVIQFLEKIASSATLMDNEAWRQELKSTDMSSELKRAIENKDQTAIECLSGSRTHLVCGQIGDDKEENILRKAA